MDGYVKIYRKLLENPVFQNANLLKVFVWCLLKATYKTREVLVGLRMVELHRGQFIYGRHSAAKELKLKPSTLNGYMNTLKVLQILDIKPNNKYSVVTLVNWDLYQSSEEETDSKNNQCPTTNRQQTDTNKKVKKGKKDIYTHDFEEFYKAYPRLEDKRRIFNNWKACLKTYTVEQLMTACENYKKAKVDTDNQYLKSSANFLGKEKPFEDYLILQNEDKQETNRYRDLTNYEPGV